MRSGIKKTLISGGAIVFILSIVAFYLGRYAAAAFLASFACFLVAFADSYQDMKAYWKRPWQEFYRAKFPVDAAYFLDWLGLALFIMGIVISLVGG